MKGRASEKGCQVINIPVRLRPSFFTSLLLSLGVFILYFGTLCGVEMGDSGGSWRNREWWFPRVHF